ncbi:MAG: hypothetical protein E7519_03485 [Ruminococcaceae bacterium]|nr:hypothetical protein [Oscillospiraceae bacterium]
MKIIDKIMQAADQSMVDQAKDYFEKNKTKYNTIKDIHYEIDENGAAKEKVLTQSEMGTLRTADGELFTFLYRGKSGDEKEYALNGQKRRVKILSVGREEATFESVKSLVMRDYVALVYYEYLVDLVSKNNPVEFSQNIK